MLIKPQQNMNQKIYDMKETIQKNPKKKQNG